jgi:hypothetical protein
MHNTPSSWLCQSTHFLIRIFTNVWTCLRMVPRQANTIRLFLFYFLLVKLPIIFGLWTVLSFHKYYVLLNNQSSERPSHHQQSPHMLHQLGIQELGNCLSLGLVFCWKPKSTSLDNNTFLTL